MRRIAGKPVIKRVAHRVFDDAGRLRGRQPVFGLALEFRLANEHGNHAGGAAHYVVAAHDRRALGLTQALRMILDPFQQRAAQPGFVRAAVRRRDGVAVRGEKTVGVTRPGDRPLRAAMHAGLAGAAGENIGMNQRGAVDRGREILPEPIGEMERAVLRHTVDAAQEFLGAGPADFHTAEQIGLGARHLEHALRFEVRLLAEDLRIRAKAHLGAAPVGNASELFQLALGFAALEHHAVERLLARDLDLHPLRERVGHRDTHSVQTARCAVYARTELSSRVQGAHDHFEGRFLGELRMRVDGNAAAVVGHADVAVPLHFDSDEAGVPLERLVHGIVDHLGKQVMQRLLVGPADVHAGAAAHRLETFEHFDMTRGIAALGAARRLARAPLVRRATRWVRQIREQIPG